MCSSTPCLPVVDVERFTTLSTTSRVTTIAVDEATNTSDATTLEETTSLKPNTSLNIKNFQSSTEQSVTNNTLVASTTNTLVEKQEGKSLK